MAFRGHFDHSLDAKHRLTVPSKFRASFASGLVLAPGAEACLKVWIPEAFDADVEAQTAELHPGSRKRQQLIRFFSQNAFDMELDSAGRVTLNKPLLDHAGITKDVVIGGNGDHLEVWDHDRWHKEQSDFAGEVLAIAESYDDPD